MKKIGFIDYYLSEWHANNYPAWMRAAAKKLGLEYEISYAWAELSPSPLDGVTSEEWCKKHGATLCESIEELCERSDVIVILAPSNPEKHPEYAERALKYGKRTYIDKTFATDISAAKKIYEYAEAGGANFFSTSALRYATELSPYTGKCTEMDIKGGGSNAPEYIIHQIEMLVMCIGTGATNVNVVKTEGGCRAEIGYPDQRRASLDYAQEYDFSLEVKTQDGERASININSAFFDLLIEDILKFFDTGILPFAKEETLEAMKIRGMYVEQYEGL